jgi:hypothetical protein
MDCDHFMDQKNILKFIYCFMIIFLIVDIFKHFFTVTIIVILSLIIFVGIGFNMSIHINI